MVKVSYIISDIDKALAFEWIAEYLDKSSFQLSFILILQKPAALESFLNSRNIAYHSFYYQAKKDFPRIFWQVFKLLKIHKPDVVHCHLLYGSVIGLTAAWLAGINKRIYTRHHSDYHQRYFPKGIKWDKWCNALASHIVAPSKTVEEVLTQMEGVPANKVQVVHHGFDMSYFRDVAAERVASLSDKYQIGRQAPVVGVISRFTELKGIQYIIPAFGKFLSVYPDAVLLLFNATGDYSKPIKAQLALIPERNYRLIPFEADLAAAYKLFNLFIQVSIDRTIESFGQTYVEALAAGVPAVFTLSGIAGDFIVDRENALVVPFLNSDAIYAALIELMADTSLKEKITANGRTIVQEKFNLGVMVKKLEELYAGE